MHAITFGGPELAGLSGRPGGPRCVSGVGGGSMGAYDPTARGNSHLHAAPFDPSALTIDNSVVHGTDRVRGRRKRKSAKLILFGPGRGYVIDGSGLVRVSRSDDVVLP